VILARKLRGMDPEIDPYGLPVGQGHLDAIDRADRMSRERRARDQQAIGPVVRNVRSPRPTYESRVAYTSANP
jgi:hypothetical protein